MKKLIMIFSLVFLLMIVPVMADENYQTSKYKVKMNTDWIQLDTFNMKTLDNNYFITWDFDYIQTKGKEDKIKEKEWKLNGLSHESSYNENGLDKIKFSDSDIQVIYSIEDNRLKEDIIIDKDNNFKPGNQNKNYTFELTGTLHYSSSLTAIIRGGILYLYDDTMARFASPRPFIKDANGQIVWLDYELNNDKLSLVIDYNDIENLVFPITIDPTVVAGCSENSTTVYCISGIFLGNWINTTKNIIIQDAIINGTGYNVAGEILIQSLGNPGGTIVLSNASLNGYGSGDCSGSGKYGCPGSVTIVTNNTLYISDNSFVRGYGSTFGPGVTNDIDGQGYCKIDVDDLVTSSGTNNYDCYGAQGASGTSNANQGGYSYCYITIENTFLSTNVNVFDCYGGNGGSMSGAGTHGITGRDGYFDLDVDYINNTGTITINSYGGKGGSSDQDSGSGGYGKGDLDLYEGMIINNVDIDAHGGNTGDCSVAQGCGSPGVVDLNIILHSEYVNVYNSSWNGNAGCTSKQPYSGASCNPAYPYANDDFDITSSRILNFRSNNLLQYTTGATQNSNLSFTSSSQSYLGLFGVTTIANTTGLRNMSISDSSSDTLLVNNFTNQYFNFITSTTATTQPPVSFLDNPSNNKVKGEKTIEFNCTGYAFDSTLKNVTLYNNRGGSFTAKDTAALSGLTDTATLTDTFVSDGNYLWNCYVCEQDNDCYFSFSNFTVVIDTTKPTISSLIPIGSINELFTIGQSQTVNWSVSDINLDSCWYEYLGINTTVTCSDNTTTVTVNQQFDNTLTFYANDTANNNNVANSTINWSYTLAINSNDYNPYTYETANESYSLNVTYDEDYFSFISATLYYNGTPIMTSETGTGTERIFTATQDIPILPIGLTSTNYTFYWLVALTNSTGTSYINSSTFQQNVSQLSLGLCSGGIGVPSLNFTAYDEQNLTRINPFIFQGTFELWIGTKDTVKSVSIDNLTADEVLLCITPNDTNVYINSVISYDASNNTDYVTRDYHHQYNIINSTLQEVPLYLLKADSSTSFILYVRDQVLVSVAQAIIKIQRYYPGEDVYRTVQIPLTSDDGKTVGFFETETVDYRFIIMKDGEVLLTTDKQKIVGETTPFTLTFTVGEAPESPLLAVSDIEDLTANITYNNNTKIIRYTYEDVSGDFEYARLYVAEDQFSSPEIIICNTTKTVNPSIIECDISSYTGLINVKAYNKRTGEDEKLAVLISFSTNTAGKDAFDVVGLFIAWFIILAAYMVGIWNPSVGLTIGAVAIILVNLIGLASFSPVFIFGAVAVSLIMAIMLRT